MGTVKPGDRVRIRCSSVGPGSALPLASDATGVPYWIKAGPTMKHQMVSRALVGMSVGESKTVFIKPEDGYGRRDPSKVYEIETASIPQGSQIGDRVSVDLSGLQLGGWLQGIDGGVATIDANHRLADQAFTLALEVVEIKRARV